MLALDAVGDGVSDGSGPSNTIEYTSSPSTSMSVSSSILTSCGDRERSYEGVRNMFSLVSRYVWWKGGFLLLSSPSSLSLTSAQSESL